MKNMLTIAVAIFMSSLLLPLFSMDSLKAQRSQNPQSLKMLAARALPNTFDASRLPQELQPYVVFIARQKKYLADKAYDEVLLNAIDAEYTHIIPELIALGVDVNKKNPESFGRTPLIEAARDKTVQLLRVLLDAGADTKIQDNQGETALHKAASSNLAICVAQLLAAGAPINVQNVLGWTPLMEAALYNRYDSVKVLLEHNADRSFVSNNGGTALVFAYMNRYPACVQLFEASTLKK